VTQGKITDIAILALPLRTRFRQIQTREIAIFRGERWAEFSPFVEYDDDESSQWLKAALSWANDPLPQLQREAVGVNATLPAVENSEIERVLEPFGVFQTIKIKVAENSSAIEQDIERIRQVRKLYSDVRIRLDANGGFSVDAALDLAEKTQEMGLEYFEQPVATVLELKQLRQKLVDRNIELKIAADESIRKASDPLLVAREQAADIAVLKVQPLGGIAPALKIAKDCGLEVVVSSALESSVGISHGLYLAGALPEMNYDCGLATAALLAADVTDKPLIAVNGEIEIKEVEPTDELIDKYSVSGERKDWWLRRIDRCWGLLES
jgi:O-succinylbenzoate synthase